MKTVKNILITLLSVILSTQYVIAQYQIEIADPSSLVRVGMDPHPTDSTDIALAYTLLRALDNSNVDSIGYVCEQWQAKAQANYTKDKAYSSLAYLLSFYLRELANEETETQDILTADLYSYFMDNECDRLRNYLVLKYELNDYRPRSIKEYILQRTYYEDLLMFNDPNRGVWDKTDVIIANMPLQEGDKVVDVGCGFGYNSLRFSNVVGKTGMIYATDTEKAYVDHLSGVLHRNNVTNIRPIVSTSSDISGFL